MQLFTQIVKMILSFVIKKLVLNSKRMQNRSIFMVVSDFWTHCIRKAMKTLIIIVCFTVQI
ncbi:hypothetical protein LDENG_00056740, partial [Lucifuga dentata]